MNENERLILSVRVKGGDPHDITIGADVGGRLLKLLKEREARPGDPLLTNEHGCRYTRTTMSSMIMRQAERAGIKRIVVRAHVIRHTVATMADEAGASLATIAGMLNHKGLGSVGTYVHAGGASVNAARDRVREALAVK